ncbi:MAG: acyl-CoA thioesterase [Verrucomicrobiae bacterium]|nr:acyl-CoA thioesterase [Verrucomicrobiae bacterium]
MNEPRPATPAAYQHTLSLRVRYSETDQMGTYYNSRVLEWFECARTELLRSLGLPYAEMERRGVLLPLVEAHVEYLGRARYDDLLQLTVRAAPEGRARLRCMVEIVHGETGKPVARGYTVHGFTDAQGKPIRPPAWFWEAFEKALARQNTPSPVASSE